MEFPVITPWLIMVQWQVLLAYTMFRLEVFKCPLLNLLSCITTVTAIVRSREKLEIVATQEELRQMEAIPAPAIIVRIR